MVREVVDRTHIVKARTRAAAEREALGKGKAETVRNVSRRVKDAWRTD